MRRLAFALLFGISLAVFAGGALLLFKSAQKPKEPGLPILFQVPSFELTDQDGANFRSDDQLRGKVWAANFVFTRCPTICPVFTRKMAEVQKGAAPLDDAVRLVSFTVDPAYDTPAVLKAYAEKHHAKAGLWSFLTGTHEALKKTIVTDLKVHMSDASDDIMAIAHGGHFVLVDGQMNVRGFYNSEDEDAVSRLVADMTKLVKENG